MDCFELRSCESPYELLLKALSLIPISHYIFGFLCLTFVFLYYLFEIHILQDLFSGFRGQPVSFTFNSNSEFYEEVVSKCKVLHSRFLSTPWLCSPHLQTAFLQYFGNPPVCNYKKEIFRTADGGTISLDWLRSADVKRPSSKDSDGVQSDDKSPILIVFPGLMSDAEAAYIKHFAFKMANRGWNVVVNNHRGLGGVQITSDCFYNAGRTDDAREVIDHLQTQYPQAPLYAVGTSIGSNILVKYLGEVGSDTAILGAAAICCPWDLLICDRFIRRKPVQRFYDRALSTGLKDFAKLHQSIMTRLANWEGIEKSCSVRGFDTHSTCVLAKHATADTYYRKASCSGYIVNVKVPLLFISSLDDPVCTREAIAWDECRVNKNVVLATTHHGGHLAYFEGMTAKSVWWVRAADDYFCTLNSSSYIHRGKKQNARVESCIDWAPHANIIKEDGLVAAFSNEPSAEKQQLADDGVEADNFAVQQETNATVQFDAVMVPIGRYLNQQLSRRSKISVWAFAFLAITTSWPILASALPLFFKKKLHNIFFASSLKR